jgi:hypothetical protein
MRTAAVPSLIAPRRGSPSSATQRTAEAGTQLKMAEPAAHPAADPLSVPEFAGHCGRGGVAVGRNIGSDSKAIAQFAVARFTAVRPEATCISAVGS